MTVLLVIVGLYVLLMYIILRKSTADNRMKELEKRVASLEDQLKYLERYIDQLGI